MSLDIMLLRTFLEVVEHHGFALAAERVALTPSAVSGHIKRLKQAAGGGLLARATRRGASRSRKQARHCMRMRATSSRWSAKRARLRGSPLHGRLRVGASEDCAGAWLPQVLHAFRRRHPRATIELKAGITADLLRQQASGRVDVVFGKQCSRVDEAGELLWKEPLVWAYASDAALDAAGALPLALFPEPCVYREAATAALSGAQCPFRIVFESSSMAGCVSAALAGFAVTVVARSQLRDGSRECGPEDGLPALPAAHFYAFSRQSTPASAALIDAVRETGRHNRFAPTN